MALDLSPSGIPVLLMDFARDEPSGQDHLLGLAGHLQAGGRFAPLIAGRAGSSLLKKAAKLDLPLLAVKSGLLWSWLTKRRIISVLGQTRSFIVHSHDHASAGLAAALTSARPFAVHVHGKKDARPLPRGLQGRRYKSAAAIVARSTSMGGQLTGSGVENARVRIIPAGIAPEAFVRRKEREDERFVFAVHGDLTPENGNEILIRALPYLQRFENMPDWEIRLIGEGSLFDSLLETAMSLGVKGRLALLGKQECNSILPWCDALIAPAVGPALNGEDNAMPLREAWAVGLPVIASNLLAHCEIARHSENALIYPLDDPASLAAAMADVAQNAKLRETLCAGGVKSLASCGLQAMADAHMDLYENLLRGSAPPPRRGK